MILVFNVTVPQVNTQPSINNLNVNEKPKDINDQDNQKTEDQDKGNDGTRILLSTYTQYLIYLIAFILNKFHFFVGV